ncbi:MAG: hypothetical protein OEM38_05790 [Gammaproteobacteria bacterium]|nr:hypothetical protein [Gammaproteobacteria bacterium]
MFSKKQTMRQFITPLLLGFIVFNISSYNFAQADEQCIAVFYPEVRKPYDRVLKEIMTGIEQTALWSVWQHPIQKTYSPNEFESIVKQSKCKAAIGLGKSGMQLVSSITHLPVVAGAVVAGAVLAQPNESETIPTLSLMPSPIELFKRLKHFSPNIKTVTVVYSPDNNQQLISTALLAAKQQGIKLIPLTAKNLREALPLYKNVINNTDPRSNALWLLQDRLTVDNKIVLPFLLEQAWNKHFILFSSQAGHARNGVLFSVYPDNVRLGRRIGEVTQKCATVGCLDKTKIMLLQDMQTAINIRTAAHLNIRINKRNDPFVDLIFPRK